MVRPLEIWNQESGMRNSQPFQMSPIVYFYTFFSRSPIRIIIIISTRTLQDIEQNVLETLADQGIKGTPIELSFLLLLKRVLICYVNNYRK